MQRISRALVHLASAQHSLAVFHRAMINFPVRVRASVMIDSSGLVERFRGTSRAEHEGNMMPCSAVQEKHRSSAKYRDDGSKQLNGIPALNQHGSQPE